MRGNIPFHTRTGTLKRATVYFDPIIHKALKSRSIETSKSISELVNEAVKEALAEDADDITAVEERANEPLLQLRCDPMVSRCSLSHI